MYHTKVAGLELSASLQADLTKANPACYGTAHGRAVDYARGASSSITPLRWGPIFVPAAGVLLRCVKEVLNCDGAAATR
jgi:hypothetical protein